MSAAPTTEPAGPGAPERQAAFLERLDQDVFLAGGHTHGAWSDDLQHGGVPAALLVAQMERLAPPGGHLTAVTIDFLGPVPVGEVTAVARVVRPGRRIVLLAAELSVADKTLVRATAWWRRLSPGLVPDVPLTAQPLPPPQALQPAVPSSELARHLYRGSIAAMEWRYADGRVEEPGPSSVWVRLRMPLIRGEATPLAAGVLLACDGASGIAPVLDVRTHLFSNIDLRVSLLRPSAGEWVSLQATTAIDPAGGGLTVTSLGDEAGPIGVATQTLFVAPHEPSPK